MAVEDDWVVLGRARKLRKGQQETCHLTVISFKAETFVWLEHLGLKTKPESTCQALAATQLQCRIMIMSAARHVNGLL